MTTTIENLRAELEELEKRVRAISATQTSLSQLIELRKYFESMHNYLVLLNNCYTNHQIECNQYSTQIESIKEQLETINQKIENSDSTEIKEINEKIETLTLNLNFALSELDTIKGGSENTIANLTLDVETNKLNISSILEEIEEINTKLSNINALLSDHQTQINNLSSTQNTLSTTTSNLNSRLTAAENELSAITGGVDLTELDERVADIESTNGATCAHQTYSFHNAKPSNFTLYTREYYFSCSKEDMLYQKMKLTYESLGEGTLTISFFEEQIELSEHIVVDLKKHPYEYEFSRQFFPTKKANNIMIKAVSTTEIIYQTFDLWLFGKNIQLYENDKEIKVVCFNGKIYLTRYYENEIRYGLFLPEEQIDINALPLSESYYDNDRCFRYLIYTPYLQSSGSTYSFRSEEAFFKEILSTNEYLLKTKNSNLFSNNNMSGSEIYPTNYNIIATWYIRNSQPTISNISGSNTKYTYSNLGNFQNGEWFYITPVINNFNMLTDGNTAFNSSKVIALNENGYFYLIYKRTVSQVIKIGKGSYGKAYLQQDGTINVYLTNGKNVDKYSISIDSNDYTCTHLSTIENCLSVFEILDLYLLKQTQNGWILEV